MGLLQPTVLMLTIVSRVRHASAVGVLRAAVCITALAVSNSGFAQPQSPHGVSDTPAIELAATVAGAYPEVVVANCCALRRPPQFVETDARYSIVSLGAEGRIYWAPRLSALVDL